MSTIDANRAPPLDPAGPSPLPAPAAAASPEHPSTRTFRVLAIATFVLTVVSHVRYNFGRRSPWDDGHQNDVAFTPFTANAPAIILYWAVSVVAQAVYLTRFFAAAPNGVNWQYVLSNLLLMSWSYLFARSHYFLGELVVIANFLQLLAGYLFRGTYRIRPLRNWFAIHGAVIVFPLVWSHYLIFWNGAVMFGARNLPARLVANCLIWVFLIVPGFLMFITGDYLLGFASAWIAFAIGLGQLLTKVFALQWIFAFTIGAILLICSQLLAFVPPMDRFAPPALNEARQEALHSQETAPLLTDR